MLTMLYCFPSAIAWTRDHFIGHPQSIVAIRKITHEIQGVYAWGKTESDAEWIKAEGITVIFAQGKPCSLAVELKIVPELLIPVP